jgi:DegV family protein with EDD domain
LGTRSYLDGSEINSQVLYDLSRQQGTLPVLASPSVEAFAAVLEGLTRCTKDIVCIHVSGKLSRTFRNARAASEELLGRANIAVIDSQTTSAGLGVLIEEAVRLAEEGATLEDIVRQVRYLVPRLYAVFLVEDLAYLQRTGHLSRAQVLLGEMLGVKPFLSLEDGTFVPLEKARTREQAVEKLVEFVSEFSNLRNLVILQGLEEAQQDSQLLIERIHDLFPACPAQVAELGASVAALLGPRAIGVIAFDSPAR